MAQSLKEEIQTWASALEAYDSQDWDLSLDLFSRIADNSKIFTNIGLIYASLGEHELAIDNFNAAVELDNFLAIAYFQAGVSNFLLGNFEAASQDFKDTMQFMRGTEPINYEQLGLKYQLHSCAILFNQGIATMNDGDFSAGIQLLREAAKLKVTSDHNVIDDAILDRGEGYTVFSIPVGVLYRPNEKKIANMAAKDYMGKAKLITANPASVDSFLSRSNTVRTAPPKRITFEDNSGQVTRSRSATASTRPNDLAPAGPLSRSASAGNPTITVAKKSPPSPPPELPLPPVPAVSPFNLTRSKSTRAVPPPERAESPGLPYIPEETLRPTTGLPMPRRPALRVNADISERPPTPPRSESPAQQGRGPISRYGEKGLTDIYDGYLASDTESRNLPRGPIKAAGKSGASKLGQSNPMQSQRNNSIGGSSSGGTSAQESERERTGFEFEPSLRKIRVKIHFKEEVRGMVVSAEMPLSEFVAAVSTKFDYEVGGLKMKFEDEDGTKVSLRDEGDWDLAVETARNFGGNDDGAAAKVKPGEGRLKIWCEEEYA